MNNDVELIPVKGVLPTVQTQSDNVIYVPQAHKNKPGIVKEGDGINIENGVVSLNKQTVEDMIDANKWVSYGFEQNLTEDEKGMARHNIGAGDNDFTGSWLDLANRPQETVDFAEAERQKSKNLFNINSFSTKSERTTVSGNTITQMAGGSSEMSSVWSLIPVKPNTTYYIGANIKTSGDRILIFRFFDSNKNIVEQGTTGWTYNSYYKGSFQTYTMEDVLTTIQIPSNVSYIAMCISWRAQEQIISNVIISEYSDIENYTEHYGQISRKGDVEIQFAESERQKSKNLLALYDGDHRIYDTSISVPVGNILNLKSNWGIDLHFKYTTANTQLYIRKWNYDASALMMFHNLKPNTSYTFSFNLVTAPTIGDVQVNGIILTPSSEINKRYSGTFTTTSSGEYYGKSIYLVGDNDSFTVSEIMLEEDTVATDYQPYNGAIVHEKGIERVETIYDIVSGKTSFGNSDYGGGIVGGVEVTGLNLKKYKALRVYCECGPENLYMYDIDLMNYAGGEITHKYVGYTSTIGYSLVLGTDTDLYYSISIVNTDKTSFSHMEAGYIDSSTATKHTRNGISSFRVVKIEGVY